MSRYEAARAFERQAEQIRIRGGVQGTSALARAQEQKREELDRDAVQERSGRQ